MWEQGQEGAREEIVRHQITDLLVNQCQEPVFTESWNALGWKRSPCYNSIAMGRDTSQ